MIISLAFVNFVELFHICLTEPISLAENLISIADRLNRHLVVDAEVPVPIMHHAVKIITFTVVISLTVAVFSEVEIL